MRIAVIGAGAIGGLVAGYLKLKGEDVSLVARAETARVIQEKGLGVSGVRGSFNIGIDISTRLNHQPDLVILATKTQDIEEAIKDNLEFIQNSLIITAQNGIQADNLVAKYIPQENIISSIVMFGATSLERGKIVHNFEGNWIIGRIFKPNDEKVARTQKTLENIFPVIIAEDIKGMKYLKIFLNANNCIPGILGESMQEAFARPEIAKIGIGIWKEGLGIIHSRGIKLVSLPDFPLERLTKLTSLPLDEAAKIYSGIMLNLSQEPLYGSILQSIKRNKPSEIDYLNGEFVALAKLKNLRVPLNERLVAMVHEVEAKKRFFSPEELILQTKGLFN